MLGFVEVFLVGWLVFGGGVVFGGAIHELELKASHF
jgi:hypothetical protein